MADINDMMVAYAQDAVDYATKLGKQLDYSEKSMEAIEDICTILYNSIPKSFFAKLFGKTPDENSIIHVCKILGAYTGEVIRKHYGGHWSVEDFDGTTVVLNVGEIKTFPVGKIYKRLKNGPEDNVYHYYHLITRELKKE
jgi:hypothetical protein